MKTVKQISTLTGVSVRTLHHYDAIGLLKPTAVTEAGYRLYDDSALLRLQKILIFRELGFSLQEIGPLVNAAEGEQERILSEHIRQLDAKQRKLQDQITLASFVKLTGVSQMDMEELHVKNMDNYEAQAKALWGKTDAYREYQEKAKGRTGETDKALGDDLMGLFRELGTMRSEAADSEAVQQWVKKLQSFITAHYYTCTKQILFGLGQMYADGGSMTENIDNAGGAGTGAFARQAIEVYCKAE